MAEREFPSPYDDVGITAVAFDLFWKEYRRTDPKYDNVDVRRVKHDRALIEYELCGKRRGWNMTRDEPYTSHRGLRFGFGLYDQVPGRELACALSRRSRQMAQCFLAFNQRYRSTR